MRLSLCIVGCGSYSGNVLGETHDMTDEIELFFANRDLKKARSYNETYGGTGAFGNYDETARDSRVEAMHFLTPHHLHQEHALLAYRNGKHLLMEKPIARTVPKAREMMNAACDAGMCLMVTENYRFLPTVERSKQLIDQSVIGDLRFIQIQDEGYGESSSWRSSAEKTGGGRRKRPRLQVRRLDKGGHSQRGRRLHVYKGPAWGRQGRRRKRRRKRS